MQTKKKKKKKLSKKKAHASASETESEHENATISHFLHAATRRIYNSERATTMSGPLIYSGTLYSFAVPASAALPLLFVVFLFVHIYMGVSVGIARRRWHIPYPTMYAIAGTPRYYAATMQPTSGKKGPAEAALPVEPLITPEEAYGFNVVQRGHQNVVENMPFIVALLVGAWPFPLIAAGLGLVQIIGRVLYFLGYSHNVESRQWGAILIYPSLLALVGLNIAAAVLAVKNTAPY